MKKYILILAANLFIYGNLFAQHKGYKSAIGITFSPDYAYRSLLTTDSASKIIKEIQRNPQNGIMGFTSGLDYRFKLFGLVNIETGLNYTRKGWSSDSVNSKFVITNLFNYNYVVVPVKIRINLPAGRRRLFYINAGVSGGVLLGAAKTVTTSYFTGTFKTDKTAIKSDVSNKIYYSMVFGFGLDYRMVSNLYFKIEPNFQRTMSEYSKETLSSFLNSGGVNLGLLWGLK
ncbi:MAG: outer membrane beta-barrel protein [Bacteroidota bacterium]|nr:outer membrane beta-barrel protein [Bacteroidota bacterium]